jgi:cell wall-associated NlpC family hydrolase
MWGGTTPKGFDCSGFVQRVFHLNGLVIPRDADWQARFGRPKQVGDSRDLATGDLIFFGKSVNRITHVAMYLTRGLYLQASGRVRYGSLDPASELYEADLVAEWRISRDIVTPNK